MQSVYEVNTNSRKHPIIVNMSDGAQRQFDKNFSKLNVKIKKI